MASSRQQQHYPSHQAWRAGGRAGRETSPAASLAGGKAGLEQRGAGRASDAEKSRCWADHSRTAHQGRAVRPAGTFSTAPVDGGVLSFLANPEVASAAGARVHPEACFR